MSVPDDVTQISDTSWTMWAVDEPTDGLSDIGNRWYASEHAFNGEPVVPVRVSIDERGPYWGFIDSPKRWLPSTSTEPHMIFSHWGMFSMCFTYGPEAEVKKGNGTIVRLTVESITEP